MPVVLDLTKKNISNDLRFCFYNLENRSNPKQAFKINDRIIFDVLMVNPEGKDLVDLAILVRPGKAVKFKAREISIKKIQKGERLIVTRIEGKIVSDPEDLQFYNGIAEVTVS